MPHYVRVDLDDEPSAFWESLPKRPSTAHLTRCATRLFGQSPYRELQRKLQEVTSAARFSRLASVEAVYDSLGSTSPREQLKALEAFSNQRLARAMAQEQRTPVSAESVNKALDQFEIAVIARRRAVERNSDYDLAHEKAEVESIRRGILSMLSRGSD